MRGKSDRRSPAVQFCSLLPEAVQADGPWCGRSVVADIVVSSEWMADLFLRRKEIPNHEKGSQTACGSGANQFRPSRRVTILTKIHCICIVATAQLGPPGDGKFSG